MMRGGGGCLAGERRVKFSGPSLMGGFAVAPTLSSMGQPRKKRAILRPADAGLEIRRRLERYHDQVRKQAADSPDSEARTAESVARFFWMG
jgi:hypothetical protein